MKSRNNSLLTRADPKVPAVRKVVVPAAPIPALNCPKPTKRPKPWEFAFGTKSLDGLDPAFQELTELRTAQALVDFFRANKKRAHFVFVSLRSDLGLKTPPPFVLTASYYVLKPTGREKTFGSIDCLSIKAFEAPEVVLGFLQANDDEQTAQCAHSGGLVGLNSRYRGYFEGGGRFVLRNLERESWNPGTGRLELMRDA